MRNSLKIILLLLAPLLILPTLSLAAQFKVTRVYDGDTIKAEGHDIEIKVRLVSIDALELSKGKGEPGQPYSQ
jgi:endonuclease YncB( thermonuclease family)